MHTPTLQETIKFIQTAHAGQTWGANQPYWHHPCRVMARLPEDAPEFVRHAALLHDVIEDTEYSAEDLLAMGYADDTIEIVNLVTNKETPVHASKEEFLAWYENKIRDIINSGNYWAVVVKRCDMSENFNKDALEKLPAEKAAWFRQKYTTPFELLTQAQKDLSLSL